MISDQRSETQAKRLSIINPLDEKDWDSIVARFPQHSQFHSAAWLRTLTETYGFTPIAVTLSNEKGYSAILLLMEINSWLTGKRGVSLPFSDYCTPLYTEVEDGIELYEKSLDLAKERGWKYLEIRDAIGNLSKGAHSISYYTHSLSLEKDPDAIFGNLASSNRRAIRKAEKSDLEIVRGNDLEDVRAFYSLLCLTRKRHGLPPQPLAFFEKLFEHFLSEDKGSLFLASKDSYPVAGALFLHQGRNAIYKFGASNKNFQELRANNLVMWNAIKWFSESKFENLDFGRTSFSNEGLRKFKLQWSTDESVVHYDRIKTKTGEIEPQREGTEGWFNQFFRALPTPLSKAAGTFLYKHVA